MILFSVLMLVACQTIPESQHGPFPQVEEQSLWSAVLGEQRSIYLHVPEGYVRDGSMPIVVVTDAKSQFPLVDSYLSHLSGDWPRLPKMVVVGVVNTNRNRDFVPRADPNFAGTGGADRFATFLRDELLPHVEAQTGGALARILLGHSFGGVNALNVLLTDETLFDAYVAIGTSTWVADRVLFERAEQRFAKPARLRAWLYMAVAERDGGATVPDGEAFARLLQARAPAELDWRFEVIPKTDHMSAVPVAIDRAFTALYPVWDQQAAVLDAATRGPAAIRAWFAAERERLDWRFLPHAWDLMIAAYQLSAEGKPEEALTVLSQAIEAHPQQSELLIAQGDVYLAQGRRREAEQAWQRALAQLRTAGAPDYRAFPVRRRLRHLQEEV
ncbi:MAG: alpha/beta hydrolase-fold protein [Pseudomonadota bacterium]